MAHVSGSDMTDMSDSDSSSVVDHEETCDFHQSSRNGLCFALTYAKKPCRNNANVTRPGYLPVCGRHKFSQQYLPAGKCQAIEDCGQLCNRLALLSAPYNLCTKHQDGSDSLPCHFMRLPTELRLMIFRYLIPKDIYHGREVQSAILYVSRQVHQEVSSVLYGESHFEASIDEEGIYLLNKSWNRTPIGTSKTHNYSVGAALRQDGARLIQNLSLTIRFGSTISRKGPKGIGVQGITKEEYHLYIMRDNARKFVELITLPSDSQSGLNALKRFNVKVTIWKDFPWSPKEAVNALFLVTEPLQSLRGIHRPDLEIRQNQHYTQIAVRMEAVHSYQSHREKLLESLQAPATAPGPEINTVADNLFEKIQIVYQFVQDLDASGNMGKSWISTIFHGIERPLHLARVAYEIGDISALEKIREAIKVRWVNAQREQHQSLQLVADSINGMFVDSDDESDSEKPRDMFPDVFDFNIQDPIPQKRKPDNIWQELEWKDKAPQIGEDGVRVREMGLRVHIRKDGKNWIRLATPAVVRAIRAAKTAAKGEEL